MNLNNTSASGDANWMTIDSLAIKGEHLSIAQATPTAMRQLRVTCHTQCMPLFSGWMNVCANNCKIERKGKEKCNTALALYFGHWKKCIS